MGFMSGKRVLIVGLATERSIAHGIAAAMRREGAELAFTYQNDRLKERVVDMARELRLDADAVRSTSAATPRSRPRSRRIGDAWGSLDCIVHSVAFAPREQLAAAISTRSRARGSGSRTTSRATASRRSPRPAGR